MGNVIELLKDLISIPTVNDPQQDLRVGISEGERIAGLLRRYGFDTDILVNDNVPILLNVIGEGRPVILYLAHFDVVPPGPGWSVTEPFKPLIRGDKLYGRGAADDKSNVAAITWALKDYSPRRGTIIIAYTGDEEIGGGKGAGYLSQLLEKEGLLPDYLINGDGSLSRIIVRRRNAFNVKIRVKQEKTTVKGVINRRQFETRMFRNTMHSAYFIPGVDTHALISASLWVRDNDIQMVMLEGEWVKSNVLPRSVTLHYIEEGKLKTDYDESLTRLLKAIVPITRTPIPVEKYSDYGVTINPNMYNYNRELHELTLDIRAMTTNKRALDNSIRGVLREVLPDAEASIKGGSGYLYTPNSSTIVKKAIVINKSLGLCKEPVEGAGASDSRYFSPKGVEAIDYGPLGENIHGPDEFVYISHLYKSIKFYRKMAESLTY